jgi:hypothetical protein
MSIRVKVTPPAHTSRAQYITRLAGYVSGELGYEDGDRGRIEDMQCAINSMREALAVLVEVLVERKGLKLRDVAGIVGSADNLAGEWGDYDAST